LTGEEPCLGAFFSSYSFNPAFFEDHVLRAVLRLTSDPIEHPVRYHHEARRALQEVPVIVVVDAAERSPGRRLPFDLLEVSDVVFHPKSVLLLYREFARLLIGSGNLTFSGYSKNAELFLCTDLKYDNDADVSLLAVFHKHLGRVKKLFRQKGTQFDLFIDELNRKLPRVIPEVDASLAFLDSTNGPILTQLKNLLPENAKIESIGMLAPFFEKDDAAELDATSVFGALLPDASRNIVLDVGISWENPQMSASNNSQLDEGLNCIWTWEHVVNGIREHVHLVPISIGPNTINYIDDKGNKRRWKLEEVNKAIEDRTFWRQPPPVAYAPRNSLDVASDHFSMIRRWLHPATRLIDGKPIHRPLHAKLLVISFRNGRSQESIVLMGSPNMSRRALLMKAGSGQGNVEIAMAFKLDFGASLIDFVPELVYAPEVALELREMSFPEAGPNHALAIDEAIHDPTASTLVITWTSNAHKLPSWRLTYNSQKLAVSSLPPTTSITINNFTLNPSSAEVNLHVDNKEFSVPILVTDLVALPASPAGAKPGLEELLMLLSRRIGIERAVQIAESRHQGIDGNDELIAFFGGGFNPTDVFRAWWSVAEDLAQPLLSAQAFRLQLEGSLGLGAVWNCMLDAVRKNSISNVDVWFYGAELLRTLGEIELKNLDDKVIKEKMLYTFCLRVKRDLDSLKPDTETIRWFDRVLSFYKLSSK